MSQLLHIDTEYKQWIQELSLRYRQSQIKASIRVNSEMLRFYWSVGKDITERQFDNKYGTHFYENLSRDLVAALNVKKGLAPTSLRYTKYFYQLYSPLYENRRQPADELVDGNRQQPADEFEMQFCTYESMRRGICGNMNLRARKNLWDMYITPAMEQGYIRMLYPDHPNSPDQAYLLTAKGLELYNALENVFDSGMQRNAFL